MTHLPQNEELSLVNFLRQNCPISPSAKSDEEEKLMELLQRQPYKGQQHKHILWTISSAIAAGIMLLWSSGGRVTNMKYLNVCYRALIGRFGKEETGRLGD